MAKKIKEKKYKLSPDSNEEGTVYHCDECQEAPLLDSDVDEEGNSLLVCPNCGATSQAAVEDGKVKPAKDKDKEEVTPYGDTTSSE
jgi:rubrerythrin